MSLDAAAAGQVDVATPVGLTGPARTASARSSSRVRATVRTHAVGLGLSCAAFVVYLAFVLRLQHDASTSAYDLGIFHQAVLSWSRFHLPVSAIKNSTDGLSPGTDLLSDHFHPVLALLAPTYWVAPRPTTLLVDQAALVAASLLPVHAFVRRRLGAVASAAVVVAYAGSIGVQSALGFDFHEVAFAPVLVALAVEEADARRWRTATAAAVLLLVVKEDFALVLPFFGLLFAVWGRRRLGAVLAVLGFGAFALLTQLVMPALGDGSYAYWTYTAVGPTPAAALRHAVSHPLRTLGLTVDNPLKIESLDQVFLPFVPFPFLSPVLVLAVPMLAERFLSDRAVMWSNGYQYGLALAPVLALAAADGLARVLRTVPALRTSKAASRLVTAAVAIAAIAVTAGLTLTNGYLFAGARGNDRLDPGRVADVRAALAVVPSGTTVAATDFLVPQLITRDDVSLLTDRLPDTSWIVEERADGFVRWQDVPAGTVAKAKAATDPGVFVAAGFHVVLSNDHVVVLTRG